MMIFEIKISKNNKQIKKKGAHNNTGDKHIFFKLANAKKNVDSRPKKGLFPREEDSCLN
jgi:hypothetical protein